MTSPSFACNLRPSLAIMPFCWFAVLTGTALSPAAAAPSTQAAQEESTPAANGKLQAGEELRPAGEKMPGGGRQGLLPPAIVLLEELAGMEAGPVPSPEGSSAAAETLSAAFAAEMAVRGVALTLIGEDELGQVDRSRLHAIADRFAHGAAPPLHDAWLGLAHPPGSLARIMERHRLDGAWMITGIAMVSGEGNRLALCAALIDRKETVRFSDVANEGDVVGRSAEPTPSEIVSARSDPRDPVIARRAAAALLVEYRTEEEKRAAEEAITRSLEPQAPAPARAHAAEFRLGVGIFFISGVDLAAAYLPKDKHWQFGYRYVRWTDEFEDPYTGGKLTETTDTRHGPQVNYLFRPERPGTWHVGAALLQWTKSEFATMNGVTDSDSVVAPYLGGGYTHHLGKHGYLNGAMYFAPLGPARHRHRRQLGGRLRKLRHSAPARVLFLAAVRFSGASSRTPARPPCVWRPLPSEP
jgi:hypothetical protein